MVNEHFSDELVEDVLIEGPIHKTMLVFQRAEGWTGGRAIATAAFLSASLALLWSWVTNSVLVGLLVLMVHILLVGVDTAVLITLPKKENILWSLESSAICFIGTALAGNGRFGAAPFLDKLSLGFAGCLDCATEHNGRLPLGPDH